MRRPGSRCGCGCPSLGAVGWLRTPCARNLAAAGHCLEPAGRRTIGDMPYDDGHATEAIQDVVVAVWRGDASAERINGLADTLRVAAQRNAERIYLYNIITHDTPIPNAAAREALQIQFASMRGRLMGAAIVLEKVGAEGALSRAILTTVVTVTRQPFPMRIFSRRRDALVWLKKQGCAASAASMTTLSDSLWKRMTGSAPARFSDPRIS